MASTPRARLLYDKVQLFLRAMEEKAKRSPTLRYAAAGVIFATAYLIRTLLADGLPPGLPYLTFFPAILINTYLAGFAVGIATLLASALAANVMWLGPHHILTMDDAATLATIAFLLTGALIVWISHQLREQQERSQAFARAREEIELRLKTALGAAHLATWDYHLATGVMTWDGPFRHLLGLRDGQEPSLDSFFSILHPEDRPA